ncbi:hypothetical protein AGMMS49975_23080 [Clostridia bacterium]|nr:hypothetical protein AGMMS49975_23080 [Clostridia bacterium]
MKLILNTEYNLYEHDGEAYCDSLQVADEFRKQHKNVLQTIENLDCGEEFRRLNFKPSDYKNAQNKKQPRYLITKDGFMFLVMGFTGKKAALIKELYIKRFNQMDNFIKSLFTARMEYPELTDAIKSAHAEPKHYHFSNENNMLYRVALGMDAKAFREKNGIEAGCVIRPYLSTQQITVVERLQKFDAGLIDAGFDYEVRKRLLENYRDKIMRKLEQAQ